MRLVVARCQVDYAGRLTAHLPMATRLLIVKADGSVLVHSDGGSYKPLNWMSPPCTLIEGVTDAGEVEWLVEAKSGDTLRILIEELVSDVSHDLGVDPGLQKDGVEKHLQELLADHPATLGPGLTLVRREYPTAIGPVDLLCRDGADASLAVEIEVEQHSHVEPSHVEPSHGALSHMEHTHVEQSHELDPVRQPGSAVHVAVEIKRKAGIDAVEQLTRYVELLSRDPLLKPVRGLLAAQSITPQARTLAGDRRIECVVVDYDVLRGLDDPTVRLF